MTTEDEIFYDSLDEETSPDEEYVECLTSEKNEEETECIPLYSGEIPKNKISTNVKKKMEIKKPPSLITPPYEKTTKKSYLTMYYEKMNRLKGPGSNTTRAVCENLTPRRDDNLERDFSINTPKTDDSDLEENFYKKLMSLEMENSQNSKSTLSLTAQHNGKNKSKNSFSSQSSFLLKSVKSERPFYLSDYAENRNEKWELLKKRQNYGMKMTMKNKIKYEETKALRKIKNSNLGRGSS